MCHSTPPVYWTTDETVDGTGGTTDSVSGTRVGVQVHPGVLG